MSSDDSSSSRYRAAGVDIDAGEQLVQRIGPLVRRTFNTQVLTQLGGFGGLYQIPDGLNEPVLVCGTDGVGTKLRLTQRLDRYDTIGIDLVAMCANDILTSGARAHLFLDYYACASLNVAQAQAVIQGIVQGCEQAGCALLGGETAEMPRLYRAGDYDLAGFCVGIAERAKLLPKPEIEAGDVLIGLDSSGVHSNGFSLIHTLLEAQDGDVDDTRLEALLRPTVIYEPHVRPSLDADRVLAMAHITGGGLTDNVPRILPENLAAHIDSNRWERPELFRWIQEQGHIDEAEMRRVFNCGIGMVLISRAAEATTVVQQIRDTGIGARVIGELLRHEGPPKTLYSDAS